MSRISLKSLGLAVLAAAVTFTVAPVASLAQSSDASTVRTVPNLNAAPRVTGKIDDTKLTALKLRQLPDGAKEVSRVDGAKVMTLEVRLRRSQPLQSAVAMLRGEVQDPTTKFYNKTLTPTEFAQNFGLAGSDLTAVTGWLKSQGFEVGNVDNGRMVIGFTGTVAQVETAFHTELHNYTAKDGSQHFAPSVALQVPKALGPAIANVAGVENFHAYQAAGFNAPVKDFAPGTMGAISDVATSGKTTPSLDGELLHDTSFTSDGYAIGVGGHATLNVRIGGNNHPATGSLTIVNDLTGATVAHIADITTCSAYNDTLGRSCSIAYAPKGATTAFLKAIYSGNEFERGTSIGDNIISFVGTNVDSAVTTITSAASTYYWYSGSPSTTFTSIVSYAGAAGTTATSPTSTYTLTETDANGSTVFVAATNLSTCTQSTANHTFTCTNTATGTTLDNDAASYGGNQIVVNYLGDTNYAAASGSTYGYDSEEAGSEALSAFTVQGSFTGTHTYGAATTDSGVTGLTLTTAVAHNPGYSTCTTYDDFTGPVQIGNLLSFENAYTTSKTTSIYAPTFTEPAFTIPALVTPGTYTVNTTYTGGNEETQPCEFTPFASTTALSLTVGKQAPTPAMTAPTAAAPVIQGTGVTTPFTVSGTLAWTGTGIAPTTGNVSFTTTAGGSFGTITCTTASGGTTAFPKSPYTCSATYTPSGTAGVGNYNLNLSFSTDSNYSAIASTVVGNYQINNKTTPTFGTMTFSPAATEPYGASQAITISDTLTYAGGTAPSGAVTYVLNGVTYTATCDGAASTETCTATVPAATIAALPVNTYTVTASFAGDTNFNTTTGTSGTFTITQQTPTFGTMSVSPGSSPYGTAQAVTLSDTLNYTGTGAAPTGAVKYVLNTVSYTATCVGSSSPLTCTATVPAATVAALPVATYTVTVSYTADTNYAAATGASGMLIITPGMFTSVQMTTSAYATPPTPTTEAYGATTAFSVYATLSPAGSVAPTSVDVTFATSTAGIGTFGATTCTVVSGVARCTALFTPNGTAVPGSYNINVSFSGDANYMSAGPSTNGTGLYVVTNATPTLTFSPSPITSVLGSTNPITVTVTASGGDTGTVNFTGTYATYGTLSATSCTITSPATNCSVTFTPNGTTAVGTYTNILTATLAANGFFNAATANDSLTITAAPTYMAVYPNYTGLQGNPDTLTAVLSWTTTGTAPSGTITFYATGSSTYTWGTATLPVAPATTTSGSSAANISGTATTSTYSCTTNTTDQIVTCTITNADPYGFNDVYGLAETTAAYVPGTTAYAASSANLYTYTQRYQPTASSTVTPSGSLTSSTYGLTTAESQSVTVTATGAVRIFGAVGTPEFQIWGNGAVGDVYANSDTTCTSLSSCPIATAFTIPAVVTPGTYTITYDYSGSAYNNSTDDPEATATASLTENKQTPTFGTMTFSPAATEPQGTSQAITISDTLQYLGIGAAPTGAVTYNLNSVNYTATCALTGVSGSGNAETSTETCKATVPAATIAALAVNTYTVTAAYAGDVNYAMTNGTSGTFTITAVITPITALSLSVNTPGTTTAGSTSAGVTTVSLIAAVTPAVAGVSVTFTDSTTGNSYTAMTDGTGTVTIMVPASIAVSAGLNSGVAAVTGAPMGYTCNGNPCSTSNTIVSNTVSVYFAGLLLSTGSYYHNFSTVGTVNGVTAEGTYDGSPVCNGSNGTNGVTCTAGFAVQVGNFTSSTQMIGDTFMNATSKSFSVQTNCPSTGLLAGGNCLIVYYYNPVFGDGCNPSLAQGMMGACTLDGSGYPQGTFEEAMSTLTDSSTIFGIGVLTSSCKNPPPAGSGCTGTLASSSGPATFPIDLVGKALLPANTMADLAVTPTSLTFGPQAPGALSATQDITLTNESGASMTLNETSSTGTNQPFSITTNCGGTLAAGASCQIQVSYSDASVATDTGTLILTPNGSTSSAVTVNLSGSTVANAGLSLNANAHNFGTVSDGTTSSTFGLSITNNSMTTATLSYSFSPNPPAPFAGTSSCGAMLAPGKSCEIYVTFSPTSPGAYSDALTITANLPILPGGTTSAPYTDTVTFTGMGTASTGFTATSVGHNYGPTSVGSTATPYGVELSNNTGSTVTLSTLGPIPTAGSNAGFSAQTNCGATLANNASCELVFNFTPAATGTVSTVYPISANNGAVPLMSNGNTYTGITLTGTGD